jgi:hypothetical protein
LKEEALDRTLWRSRLGRGYGPVVRQTTEWMSYCGIGKTIVVASHHIHKTYVSEEAKWKFALYATDFYIQLRSVCNCQLSISFITYNVCECMQQSALSVAD